MLVVENLTASYGDLRVLYGVSLSVREGQVVVLLGANGAGKSTLLRSIAGQMEGAHGSIRMNEEELLGSDPPVVVRKGVTLVPEGRRLFPFLTVEDNLLLGAYTVGDKSKTESSLAVVYDMFPVLRERRGQLAGSLSGGEQQMCALGRGLMSSPRILMLDEPSLGLAPLLVKQVFAKITEIRDQGVTILLAEQAVQQALAICDHAYVLEGGHVLMHGPPDEVLESDRLKIAYLGL